MKTSLSAAGAHQSHCETELLCYFNTSLFYNTDSVCQGCAKIEQPVIMLFDFSLSQYMLDELRD